jgi:hypothetical protein
MLDALGSATLSIRLDHPYAANASGSALERKRGDDREIPARQARNHTLVIRSQPVRLQRVTYEDRSKTAWHREISQI